jgi:hypothetical protein
VAVKTTKWPIVAADFDGTIANTFEKSPNGLDVPTAYDNALTDIFGSRGLLAALGGLRNRAPGELVVAVLEHDHSLGARGHEYHRAHGAELSHLVLHGKGNRANINPGLIDELTETLVRVKLQYLVEEISDRWPKPYDGVLDFIEMQRRQGRCFAIITSGHDLFLQRTFKRWGIRCPEYTVTDDDLRGLDLPYEHKCKPSKFLWDVLGDRVRTVSGLSRDIELDVRLYLGDCAIKDRGLAWNGNVPFGWFNPKQLSAPNGFGTSIAQEEFQFASWSDMHLLR